MYGPGSDGSCYIIECIFGHKNWVVDWVVTKIDWSVGWSQKLGGQLGGHKKLSQTFVQ